MQYVEFLDPVLVTIAELMKRYPEIDWSHQRCAFSKKCKQKVVGLLCATVNEDKYADYEPADAQWRSMVFDLRSTLGTNFEFTVCESHAYGLPE